MNLLKRIYSSVQSDWLIEKGSCMLSYKEINSVCLAERPHYVSSKKAIAFLEALDIKVPLDEKIAVTGSAGLDSQIKMESKIVQEKTYKNNLFKEVKLSISTAIERDIIVSYEKCERGKYVLMHFPFYNGTMELKGCKRYEDIYWWCGTYRDLRVYACGNKNNRIDDAAVSENSLWDPSGSRSSKEFFDKINDYVIYDSHDYTEKNESAFFDKLSCTLHRGTIRGNKDNLYQGWYEMLLRCDCVERENGCIKIFGSPVFVTYDTIPGYGWYLIGENKGKKYYREWSGSWMEHYFEMESFFDYRILKKYVANKKIYMGFDAGYCIKKSEGKYSLLTTHKVRRLTKAEIINACPNIDEIEIPHGIDEIGAVCLTAERFQKIIEK